MKRPVLIRISPLWSRCPLWCILWVLCTTSCERRELTYYNEAEITLTADWSKADMQEEKDYGATAIFYPQDGGAPQVLLMGNRTHATLRLPQGTYDVILFNRSFGDFSSVAFRGQDRFETLEAYAKKVETRSDTRVIVSSPEKLATAVIRGFRVTEGMLGNYAPEAARGNSRGEAGGKGDGNGGSAGCSPEECTLHLDPLPLTREVLATLNVKGLQNLRKAQCILSEVPLSVFLADGSTGRTAGKQEFTAGDPVFNEGSQTEGTLTGKLNVFGIDEAGTHTIEFNALLVDGKTEVKQELSGVTVREDGTGSEALNLYIEAEAPEPLPDVKPEGGSDSGFEADVDEWGKEESTDLPV